MDKILWVPGIGIATIAAAAGLCVIKGNVVTVMIGLFVTHVTEDTGFIRLAGPTDPYNVVAFEWKLSETTRNSRS